MVELGRSVKRWTDRATDPCDALHGAAILAHLQHGEAVTIPSTALECAMGALKEAGLHEAVTVTETDDKATLNMLVSDLPNDDDDESRSVEPERRWKGGYPQGMVDWYNDGADGAIDWGSDGDFEDCVSIAGKYIDNPEGFCNLRHQDATGAPPGKAPGESEDKSLADRFHEYRASEAKRTVNGKPTRGAAVAEKHTPLLLAAYKSKSATQIADALKALHKDAYVAGLQAAAAGNQGPAITTAIQADPVLTSLTSDDDSDDDDEDIPTNPDDASGSSKWAAILGLVTLLAQDDTSGTNIVSYMDQDGTPDIEDQATQMAESEAAAGAEAGAQDASQAAGFDQMQSEPDDDACQICLAAADQPYDIGDDGPPWHPRCGCGSEPSGSSSDQENAFALGRNVRRWSQRRVTAPSAHIVTDDPTYEDRATPDDTFKQVESHIQRGTLAWEERDLV